MTPATISPMPRPSRTEVFCLKINAEIAYLEGKGQRVLDALDEIAGDTGAALATIALAWTMAQPGITAALASATSVDQLKQLTAAMHLKLTREQIARLDEASAEVVPA